MRNSRIGINYPINSEFPVEVEISALQSIELSIVHAKLQIVSKKKWPLPNKVRFFLMFMAKGKLLTNSNLQKRNWPCVFSFVNSYYETNKCGHMNK
jgi:hypothetical protein